MIKLTRLVSYHTEEWKKRKENLAAFYELEREEFEKGMRQTEPTVPTIEVTENDIETVEYAFWINTKDIKQITVEDDGNTILLLADLTHDGVASIHVRETPEYILNYKND